MPKQPLFLNDIADVLDPIKLRDKIQYANMANIPEWIYKLTRTLAELLKATIELNENTKEMVEEIRMMRKSINELKSVIYVDESDEEDG